MVKPRHKESTIGNILAIILDEREITFTNLQKKTGLSNNTMSQYIKELRDNQLIKFKVDGKKKIYSIDPSLFLQSKYFTLEVIQKIESNFEHYLGTPDKYTFETIKKLEKTITGFLFLFLMDGLRMNKNSFELIRLEQLSIWLIKFIVQFMTKGNIPEKLDSVMKTLDFDEIFKEFKNTKFTLENKKRFTELHTKSVKRYSKQFDMSFWKL